MSDKFTVLAVPGKRTFVVAPGKVEEFKNTKPDLEKRKEMEDMLSKLNIRNKISVKIFGFLKK